MEIAAGKQADIGSESRQKKIGFIMIGLGLFMLVAGVFLLRSTENDAHVFLKNLAPLVPMAGVILALQGLLVVRLKGNKLTAWFMAMPAITIFLLLGIFPLLYALRLSMVAWDLQNPEQNFVFLQNFVDVLSSARVHRSLINTFVITFSALVVELIVGIGLARLAVDRFPGRSIFISIALLPLMMSPIVTGFVWSTLWDSRLGAINHALSFFTNEYPFIAWTNDAMLGLIAITITTIWKGIPFVFLIVLSALLAVDLEIYEAAEIDGASPVDTFFLLSLPIIRPVLLVVVVFRTMDILNLVATVLAVTSGGPNYATETFTFHIYREGFTFARFGYSAAASFILLIISAIVSSFYIRRIGET